MPTCAVISRIQLIEAPYLNEFVFWYLSLGFDRIYFINTEAQFMDEIKAKIAPELLEYLSFLSIDKTVQNEPNIYLLNLIKRYVKEDFLLNVDSDELLFLDPCRFSSIKDFLNHYGKNFYVFEWINVPCFELFSSSMVGFLHSDNARMYYSSTRKSLGRVENLQGIDWHVMNGGHAGLHLNPLEDHCFVFHFLVRSVSHQLLKQYHQSMGNFKDRNQQLLESFLMSRNEDLRVIDYPFRMLSMLLLKRILEKDNIKPSLEGLINEVQKTPEKYHARVRHLKNDVLLFLRSIASDNDQIDIKNLSDYLNDKFDLKMKLDAKRLPAQICEYSEKEELRVTMNRIYGSLDSVGVWEQQ